MSNNINKKFFVNHLLIPITFLALTFYYFMYLGGDSLVAAKIYALQGYEWSLNDHWVTNKLLHKGGKHLSTLAIVVIIALYIFVLVSKSEQRKKWRSPLLYLILSSLVSVILVSLLKVLTNMDCPWNLNQFGGDRPFIGLFEHRPQEMGCGKCFPAGHASAGYAWVSLYFFFKMIIPKYRWLGLLCGIMVGLTFGISQQLRGAHFISHDIATILICWLIATLLFIFFGIKKYTVKNGTQLEIQHL
jgi:membrane-associated PAP2 superfamily phosphatase